MSQSAGVMTTIDTAISAVRLELRPDEWVLWDTRPHRFESLLGDRARLRDPEPPRSAKFPRPNCGGSRTCHRRKSTPAWKQREPPIPRDGRARKLANRSFVHFSRRMGRSGHGSSPLQRRSASPQERYGDCWLDIAFRRRPRVWWPGHRVHRRFGADSECFESN
jgi:hypothetical protein